MRRPLGRPLRIGVVGAGWAGQRHIRAFEELGGRIEAVWLVDNDSHFVDSVADSAGVVQRTVDVADVLNDPLVDAVAICTPHILHAEMTKAAAEAGKHVMVEKPMALSVRESAEMVAAARVAGVSLVVAENQVYDHITRSLVQAIHHDQAIGSIAFGHIIAGYRAPDPRYDGRRGWLTDPEKGGTGTWWLQGVHTVARCRAIFGEITRVQALEHRTSTFARDDIEGTISCLLSTESGASVHLVQTPEVALAGSCEIRAYGEDGRVEFDGSRLNIWQDGSRVSSQELQEEGLSSYARQYQALLTEIDGGAIAPTNGDSELKTIRVVEGALKSIETGTPVSTR